MIVFFRVNVNRHWGLSLNLNLDQKWCRVYNLFKQLSNCSTVINAAQVSFSNVSIFFSFSICTKVTVQYSRSCFKVDFNTEFIDLEHFAPILFLPLDFTSFQHLEQTFAHVHLNRKLISPPAIFPPSPVLLPLPSYFWMQLIPLKFQSTYANVLGSTEFAWESVSHYSTATCCLSFITVFSFMSAFVFLLPWSLW